MLDVRCMTPQMKYAAMLFQMIEQPIESHQPVFLHDDGAECRPSRHVRSLRTKISDQYTAPMRIELQ
jgi:hypothetical protein